MFAARGGSERDGRLLHGTSGTNTTHLNGRLCQEDAGRCLPYTTCHHTFIFLFFVESFSCVWGGTGVHVEKVGSREV